MPTTKSLAAAFIALACVIVGVLGAKVGVLPSMIGFGLFLAGGAIGLLSVIWGLVAKLRKTARGGALAAIVGVIPLALVAVPAAIMSGKSGPGINDITTDPGDPPMFAKATEHGEYPKDFIAKSKEAYPKLAALELSLAKPAAVKLVLEVAKAEDGWQIDAENEDGFEGHELTSTFRFRDDFVVRVRSAGAGQSVVDMRSASRSGKADFGVNAARIESFLAAVAGKAKN